MPVASGLFTGSARVDSADLARFLDERETRIDEPLEYGGHDAGVLLALQRHRQSVDPRLQHRAPAESARLQVDHSTPTHCCRLRRTQSIALSMLLPVTVL